MILFSYLCALLPLAAIYALDFINRDWKSVRDTRCHGLIHLTLSLPPLAVVIFYIHLQRLAEDYKEMATAITAAILCILHVLHTAWGLVQLRVFKEWNTHALFVLTRLGFDAPKSIKRAEERGASKDIPSRIRRALDRIRKDILKLNLSRIVPRLIAKSFRTHRQQRIAAAGRQVGTYMMENSSLLDNEIFGADLPCRPNLSLLRNLFVRRQSSVPDFLTSKRVEEYAIRWTASFLACFGPQWLIHTKRLASLYIGDQVHNSVPNRILTFISFCVTCDVSVPASERGQERVQPVSLFSPLHVMCSNLNEPWVSNYRLTGNNVLPCRIHRRRGLKQIEFAEHARSLQNFITNGPRESLNELEEDEKNAVLNITPHQISCFVKQMEERDSRALLMHPSFLAYLERVQEMRI